MNERNSSLDRLEARLNHQAARIDELYRVLKARGIISPAENDGTGDALFDEFVRIDDAFFSRERHIERRPRRKTRLHVGTGTGV